MGNGGATSDGRDFVFISASNPDLTLYQQNPFTKDGYTQEEWNTQADGKGTAQSLEDWRRGDSLVLFAQWRNDLAVDLIFQDGDVSTTQTAILGESITLPIPQRAAHTFDGWLCANDGKVYPGGSSWLVEKSVSFTAQWTRSESLIVDGKTYDPTQNHQEDTWTYTVSEDGRKINLILNGYQGGEILIPAAEPAYKVFLKFHGVNTITASQGKPGIVCGSRLDIEGVL